MTREDIVAEMVRVAEALENPDLSDAQRARGLSKYETLEEELRELDAAAEREELRQQEPAGTEREEGDIAASALALIFNTLDPSGSLRAARRRAKK